MDRITGITLHPFSSPLFLLLRKSAGMIFLAALFLAPGLHEIHASPAHVAPPTLLKHPVAAEVERGGVGLVRIEAVPSYGNQVRFAITKVPNHGSLGEIQRDAPNVVSVNYSSNGNKEDSDEFTFRVFTPGKCWTTYTATLKIVDPPNSLQAIPEELNFGTVGLGESQARKLTLRNRAAGLITGNLLISPPWHLSSDSNYSLRMGESTSYTITFAPHEVNTSTATVNLLSSGDASKITLKGAGILPFTLSDSTVEVSSEKKGAELQIKNLLDHAVIVKAATDDLIVQIPPIALKAGELRTIHLRTLRRPLLLMNSAVRFSLGTYEASVAVRIPPSLADTTEKPSGKNVATNSVPKQQPGFNEVKKITPVRLPTAPQDMSPVKVDAGLPDIPKGPTLLPEVEQEKMRRLMVGDLSYFLKPGWFRWKLTIQWHYEDPPPKEFLIEERLVHVNSRDAREGGGDSVEYKRIKPFWIKPLGSGVWQASIPPPKSGFQLLRIAPVLEGTNQTVSATFQIQMPSNTMIWEQYRGPLALLLFVILVILFIRMRGGG